MTTREQRAVFGEVADDYDRIRPGYPAQLVDDVLAAAGLGPADSALPAAGPESADTALAAAGRGSVLEVGAGTGKASVAFAARGVSLTCIEPDPRMADLLRRKLPSVPIVVSTFEEWTPDQPYQLLISAQAWHWVDPSQRAGLAFRALAPGGLFAPFWNAYLMLDPALHAALAEVDERHGLTAGTPHRYLAATFPPLGTFDEEWKPLNLAPSDFPHRNHRRYHSTLSYSTADYRTYLLSISMYRILPPPTLEAALADTAAVLDAHGGTIDFEIITDVVLAHRA
jgi:SAM-dependent methyltransferase